ncbi:MAG: IS66 family transposase [Methanobacteriaceae archaeon]
MSTTIIADDNIKSGTPCPDCQKYGQCGKLYTYEPGLVVSLNGHPIVGGNKYQIVKWRCNLCNKIFIPKAAKQVLELPKYDPSCAAAIAIHKYYLGSAFYRMERYQNMLGIPLPSSTQWDLCNGLGLNGIRIFNVLECYAAQTGSFKFDDSPHKIMDAPGANQKYNSFTTGIISEYLDKKIVLYYTNTEIAGEIMEDLLSKRSSDSEFLSMSDAANGNFSSKLPPEILAKIIICFCLVHGRRNFFKIFKFFDKECTFVLDCISKVYEAEKYCKLNKLDANARLLYHQENSAPVMDNLRIWLNNKLLYKDVEPNNALGNAIKYMLKNWNELTRFMSVAGAAIDNNTCEQIIKISILHRKNSLYYRSSHGARIGSVLMSIIQTAVANSVNPFDYLIAINTFSDKIRASPELWLPWNYQEQLTGKMTEAA